MPKAEHILERRASKIAERLNERVGLMREFLTPQGQRPPFTEALNDDNAMRFWRAHRYDMLGARVLQNMRPSDIAELDAALAKVK